jgi:uncharacterized protein YkwD
MSLPPRLLSSLALSLAAFGCAAEGSDRCAGDAELKGWIARLNAVRQAAAPCAAQAGQRPPLMLEPRLQRSALALAAELAERDALSHVDAHGHMLAERLRAAGVQPSSAAENLGAGQPSFDAVLRDWLASPEHCRNVMDAAFTQVGLACVQRHDAPQERFWVLQFAAVPRQQR